MNDVLQWIAIGALLIANLIQLAINRYLRRGLNIMSDRIGRIVDHVTSG